ncbi:Ammonium transporter AmtB-like domain [Pseudocohnilembus persalinus]|uniref:Ammonium transporter AmtB-like domain n=1 Tax=Pseudocohnilembus persalinus TaxID=266149 RepID=A0A0V0QD91_PSEPJ|nr:Ammonium transporter AmtB-like domain [Pseudocohnilembus persalinus]|eukprot:KRX00096.1 Ammonium transporter AmtB-like domain [Pseudocohnilembus persalinus]
MVQQPIVDLNDLNSIGVIGNQQFFALIGIAFLEIGYYGQQSVSKGIHRILIYICLTGLYLYFTVYSFIYGQSNNQVFGGKGAKYLLGTEMNNSEFQHFFVVFIQCAISVSIFRSLLAKITNLRSQVILIAFYLNFIFGLLSHWSQNKNGWLRKQNFIDFGNISGIFLFSSTSALLISWKTKPRVRRFDQKFQGHFQPSNVNLVLIGSIFLWIGLSEVYVANFFSVQKFEVNSKVYIFLNCIVAGLGGCSYAFIETYIQIAQEKLDIKSQLLKFSMGIIAGVISVGGSCYDITIEYSFIIGVIGELLHQLVIKLMYKYQIDDPVNLISVCLSCSIWSNLATGFFLKKEGLFYGSGSIIGVQIYGTILFLAVGGVESIIIFYLLKISKIIKIEKLNQEKYKMSEIEIKYVNMTREEMQMQNDPNLKLTRKNTYVCNVENLAKHRSVFYPSTRMLLRKDNFIIQQIPYTLEQDKFFNFLLEYAQKPYGMMNIENSLYTFLKEGEQEQQYLKPMFYPSRMGTRINIPKNLKIDSKQTSQQTYKSALKNGHVLFNNNSNKNNNDRNINNNLNFNAIRNNQDKNDKYRTENIIKEADLECTLRENGISQFNLSQNNIKKMNSNLTST